MGMVGRIPVVNLLKVSAGGLETIDVQERVIWEDKEKYSVEFTKKGREKYHNNQLGLYIMNFLK